MGEVLTNNNNGNSDLSPTPSLDQVIATRTKLPPVLAGQVTFTDTVSFDAKGNPQTMQDNPAKLFDRLFGGLGNLPGDAGAERRLRLRRSILDAVAKDLGTFTKRDLPPEGRERAEAQLASIRDLETSLSQGQVAEGCTVPVRQDTGVGGDKTPLQSKAQVMNIATALACGISRSAVLQFRSATQNGDGWAQNNFGRVATTDGWHALSHTAKPRGQIECIRYVGDTVRLLADALAKFKTPTARFWTKPSS